MHLFQFFEFFPPSPQGHVLFGARTLPYSSERTWPVFPNEIMNTKMLSSTLQNVINGRGYRCYRSSLLEWPTINTLCSFHDLHLRSGCVWHCCFQGIAIFLIRPTFTFLDLLQKKKLHTLNKCSLTNIHSTKWLVFHNVYKERSPCPLYTE